MEGNWSFHMGPRRAGILESTMQKTIQTDFSNTKQEETKESELSSPISLIGNLTQDELIGILDYDPETGIFRWKISPRPRTKIGDVAGAIDRGYVRIQIDGQRYDGHVLAWFYIYGEVALVDHKDRCKANNKLVNLREADQSQNNHNRAAYNKLGVKGVYQSCNKFYSRIAGIYLGSFDSIEKAKAAYDIAAKDLFGEFADDQS